MKVPVHSVLVGFALALIAPSCDQATDTSNVPVVAFKVYTKYYFIGQRAPTDTTFFFHTTGKAAFDSLFLYVDPTPPVDTIPAADLSAHSAVSIVKQGNDMYDLDIVLVYLRGDTLAVEYTAVVTNENMSWTVVVSRIVMVDATFRKVGFIENGRLVKLL